MSSWHISYSKRSRLTALKLPKCGMHKLVSGACHGSMAISNLGNRAEYLDS